ncbi:MAG: hypothetical protein MZU97_09825 [Bacillus subtilis]|nr:hypothetical protein [Bacillus subtilis]
MFDKQASRKSLEFPFLVPYRFIKGTELERRVPIPSELIMGQFLYETYFFNDSNELGTLRHSRRQQDPQDSMVRAALTKSVGDRHCELSLGRLNPKEREYIVFALFLLKGPIYASEGIIGCA